MPRQSDMYFNILRLVLVILKDYTSTITETWFLTNKNTSKVVLTS